MPVLSGLKLGIYSALLVSLLTGCSSLAQDATGTIAETAKSDRDLPLRPVVPPASPVPGPDAKPGFEDSLTLGEAVQRTLSYSPAVKAAFVEIDAKKGDETQAGVKPNPELSIEVENFGGNKGQSGFDAAESTFSFGQTIELGDKRLKRLQAAHLDTSLAGWDYETARLNAASAAAQAFVDVLVAQDRIKLLEDFTDIAQKTNKSVELRVQGGKASPIESDRAVVALARAKALHKAELARLDAAKRKLSALWGRTNVAFGKASGRLGKAPHVPDVETLRRFLEENPTVARWADEVERRVAQLKLERAKAIPDVRVGAGYRSFNEDNSSAMVASLSVPFPIFDRNQGAIAAAERRIDKAEFDASASRTELFSSLVELHGELIAAETQLRAMEQDVLPAAQRAYERTKIGFDEGKFDILNVLDVQRTVFETRLEVLTARADFEKARVRLEALIGRDLTALQD